jgi:hypothetical protein
MDCGLGCGGLDKARLLAEYVRSVNEWADAVRSLGKKTETSPADFQQLMAGVDKGKTLAKRAKADYAAHVEEHGC